MSQYWHHLYSDPGDKIIFFMEKMHLNMTFAKCWTFCSGPNRLNSLLILGSAGAVLQAWSRVMLIPVLTTRLVSMWGIHSSASALLGSLAFNVNTVSVTSLGTILCMGSAHTNNDPPIPTPRFNVLKLDISCSSGYFLQINHIESQ